MRLIKKIVSTAAVIVFAICVYSFLLGNGVFEKKFMNEAVPWYFLAKGIFCSLALYLLVNILDALRKRG